MSDTTITMETRELLRRSAAYALQGITETIPMPNRDVLALLNALDAAEARAEQAEAEAARASAERDWLADTLPTESQNGRDLWRGPEGAEGTILYATKKDAADAYKKFARKAVAEPTTTETVSTPCPICGCSGHIGDCEED